MNKHFKHASVVLLKCHVSNVIPKNQNGGTIISILSPIKKKKSRTWDQKAKLLFSSQAGIWTQLATRLLKDLERGSGGNRGKCLTIIMWRPRKPENEGWE